MGRKSRSLYSFSLRSFLFKNVSRNLNLGSRIVSRKPRILSSLSCVCMYRAHCVFPWSPTSDHPTPLGIHASQRQNSVAHVAGFVAPFAAALNRSKSPFHSIFTNFSWHSSFFPARGRWGTSEPKGRSVNWLPLIQKWIYEAL